jgi:hypothetical protein
MCWLPLARPSSVEIRRDVYVRRALASHHQQRLRGPLRVNIAWNVRRFRLIRIELLAPPLSCTTSPRYTFPTRVAVLAGQAIVSRKALSSNASMS